ncbi:MAG: hypothetical protein Q8K70_05265 [Bacteroidota bacterium]|nr:hypothetical protein [Bacteroidota bacterium]
MNITKFYLLMLLICFRNIGMAQDEKTYKNEFHLNATGFITNYLNFGGAPNSNNPYLLGYKRIIDKSAFRFGFMGDIRTNNTNVNHSQPRSYSQTNSLNIRFGYELRQDLNKKWTVFYGLDLVGGFFDFKSKNSQSVFFNGNNTNVNFIRSNSNYSYGGGPVGGIQWNLSQRISLMAESRAYFLYTENQTKTSWEDVPEPLKANGAFSQSDNVNYFKRTEFFLPLDLFLIVKF